MMSTRRFCSSAVSGAQAENSRALQVSHGGTRCRGWALARAVKLNLDMASPVPPQRARLSMINSLRRAPYARAAIADRAAGFRFQPFERPNACRRIPRPLEGDQKVLIRAFEVTSELSPNRAAAVHLRQLFSRIDRRGPDCAPARQIWDHYVIHIKDAIFVKVVANLECEQGKDIAGGILDGHHTTRPIRRAGRKLRTNKPRPTIDGHTRHGIADERIGFVDRPAVQEAGRQCVGHGGSPCLCWIEL